MAESRPKCTRHEVQFRGVPNGPRVSARNGNGRGEPNACGALVNTGKHVSTPSMASLRGSSKRLLFEEDDQFSRGPGAGSCTCGNICNRVTNGVPAPAWKLADFAQHRVGVGARRGRACTNIQQAWSKGIGAVRGVGDHALSGSHWRW